MLFRPKYFKINLTVNLSASHVNPIDGSLIENSPCDICPGLIAIDVEGDKWYHAIANMRGALFITNALADEMATAGIRVGTGERYNISIRNVESKAKRFAPLEYSWLRPMREIDVERITPNPGTNKHLDPDLRDIPIGSKEPKSDIFGVNYPNGNLYCEIKFLETARCLGWNCFRFHPMDIPLNWPPWSTPECPVDPDLREQQSIYKRLGIEYLGENWPPQWYPQGVDPHPSNQCEYIIDQSMASHIVPRGLSQRKPTVIPTRARSSAELARIAESEGRIPTGFTIRGEPVYWFNGDGVPESSVRKIKKAVLPHLACGLAKAEAMLAQGTAEKATDTDWAEFCIIFDDEGPLTHWTLSVSGWIGGMGPYLGIDFVGSDIVDSGYAD